MFYKLNKQVYFKINNLIDYFILKNFIILKMKLFKISFNSQNNLFILLNN